MIDYRLYFMGQNGAHIERFEPIQGNSDAEAIEVAKLYAGISPLQLYQEGRKVQDFPATAREDVDGGHDAAGVRHRS